MEHEVIAQLQRRTAQLERRLRLFQLMAVCGLLAVVGYACASLPSAGAQTAAAGTVLRVRGIIIEDEAGRERILIGAPIPAAAHRVRTDRGRVREAWAGKMDERYMEWYESYRHDMHGILILDENGYDRVAVGDSVPDPNIGRRIAPGTGMVINDERGFERSGYSFLRVNGVGRVALGLDTDSGTEGAGLVLSDDGVAAFMVQAGSHSLFLGDAPAGHPLTGAAEPFHGLLLRHRGEVAHEINAARGKQ